MLYNLPASMQDHLIPNWPKGIGGIPAHLSDGTMTKIPVLEGVNVLTIGVVGTGKTKSYTLPAADKLLSANPDMKGVFFDVKKDFFEYFMRPSNDKVIVHNPTAVQNANLFQWCLVKEIRQAIDKEAEMKQIAEFLYADLLSGANQNRAWVESARNVFIGILRVVVCYPGNTTNWTLINALRRMPVKELLMYLAKHPRNHSMLRKDFGYDIDNPSDYKTTRRAEDIMFFFNQVLEKFSGSFESEGQDTIHDFLHSKKQNLFILYDLASSEISRPFILYFLKKIKDEKMSNMYDVKTPMLWCMDEIDKLSEGGKYADFGLYQAATLGREYGLQILLTTQSIENLYGLAPEFNEHITNGGLTGFPLVISYRVGDPMTIKTLQMLYGSKYIERMVIPASRYDHPDIKYELEPVVTDSDFAELKTGECIVKIKSCPPQKVHIIYKSQKGGA